VVLEYTSNLQTDGIFYTGRYMIQKTKQKMTEDKIVMRPINHPVVSILILCSTKSDRTKAQVIKILKK
jgi:hypothetical protein